jgi:multidrug efflux pump subunit AcrA (membrane-fusion protein)
MFANITLRKALIEPIEGVKAVAARASVKRYRNIAILAAAVILTIVVPWELKVSAPFKILPSNESIVTAETQGVVTDIKVKEGDIVHKGQLLARVSDFERNDLAQNYLGQLETEREQLKVMRNGTRPEDIAVQEELIKSRHVELDNVHRNQSQRMQLQVSVEEKKLALNLAQTDFDRNKTLFDMGIIARDAYDKSDTALKTAKQSVRAGDEEIHAFDEKAGNEAARITQQIVQEEKKLAMMKAGSRPDEIERQEATVSKLERVVDNIAGDLKNSDIVAKIDGTVMTEYVERKVRTHLDAGAELMRLADTSTVEVEMMVPEKEMGDVHLGLPVRIQLASFPSRYFQGKVDFIAQSAHPADGQQVMTVRSYLSNPDGVLKPELTGFAKIYCGPRRIIEVMTRRIGLWIRTEIWALRP